MDDRRLEEEDQKLIGYSGKTIDDSVVEQEKRSKKKKWIIIGLIVAALVILIIVLAVTLTKKKDNPVDPTPPTPIPTPPYFSNPYVLNRISGGLDTLSGSLYAPKFENVTTASSGMKLSASNDTNDTVLNTTNLKVNPFLIPQGVNN